MTFEEMFKKVATAMKKANAKDIEDVAVQVNVTGDGEGIFYIAAKEGVLAVEPYDYVDNDAVLTVDSKTLIAAVKNKEAAQALTIEAAPEKAAAFAAIMATLPEKKAPAKRTTTKKACATKKTTTAKKTTTKKASTKKAEQLTIEDTDKK